MKPLNPKISYFAKSNFRNQRKLFGIYIKDRIEGGGIYVLGKVGTGKSTLLKNILLSDVTAKDKRGVFVADIHNEIIRDILPFIPESRKKDIIHIDLPNPKMTYGYNPLRTGLPYQMRSLVASGLLESFKKIWDKRSWGSRMEGILRATILSLLDQKQATISDIRNILLDDNYRKACIKNIINPELKKFWLMEFPRFSKADLLPILSKINVLLSHPVVYNFLVKNKRQLSLRYAMDNAQIVLVSLSRGQLGADVANLIGGILINAISVSGFSRASLPEYKRIPFMLFLDEFSFYSTPAVLEMLSQLRKMRISALYAHQYLGQLDKEVREGLLGSVSTIITFRLGSQDAKIFAQEFYPQFHHSDFTSLANYEIYLRMLIENKQSKPFSASTLPFPLVSALINNYPSSREFRSGSYWKSDEP